MIRTIELPQVGESVTEGVIGKWLVEPGQHVEKYDPLVEVVTDKVSMEAPSPYTGVFVRALAEEGETVPMGQPICEMEVEDGESPVLPAEAGTSQPDPVIPAPSVIPAEAGIQGAWAAHEAGSGDEGDEPFPDPLSLEGRGRAESAGEGEPAAEEPPADSLSLEEESADDDAGRVGGAWAMPAAYDADSPEGEHEEEAAQPAFEFMDSVRSVGPTGSGEGGEGRRDALQEQAVAEHEEDGPHESEASSAAGPDRRHVISPLVARLSAQYGIDLSTLQGTGTGGRITSKDLLEAVNRLSAPAQEEVIQEVEEAEAGPESASPATPAQETGAEEEAAQEHLSFEERSRAESAGEVEPQAASEDAEGEDEGATEAGPAPEDAEVPPLFVEEGEGEGIAAAEEAAAPSDPLSLEGRGRAESAGEGESEAEPEETAEEAGPASEDAEVSPLLVGEGESTAEAEAEETEEEVAEDVEEAPEEEGVEDVEEALDEAGEEEAVLGAVAVEPAPIPVIPAEAGIQEPPADEDVAPEEPAPAQPAAEDTSVMPLTPVRRIIAEHMARSSREIPAAWAMVETDVTRLVRAREALKAAFEERHGIPLTYLPFAASAVAAALREHPRLNARWDGGHITLNNRVNLAVAVSTEAGLMVPVVRDADTLSIATVAAELRRLSDGARAGTLGLQDVEGGTFTLNNTGALGSVVSVPIINHPQAAILTTEAIVKRPVVVEGDAIAVRSMMNLCLTFDHRVCDGAEAAAFLSAVKARLEVVDESIGLG